MCRDAELLLPSVPQSPGAARRFVRDACLRWDLDEVAYEVTLLVSELVTNAVLHARTVATVRVSVADGVIEVTVADANEARPVARPARSDMIGDLDAIADLTDTVDAADVDARDPRLAVGASGAVTAGRGLLVVDALADEWGTVGTPTGKAVWFTLAAPPEWQAAQAACPCGGKTGRHTSTGRNVVQMPGPWDVESSRLNVR